MTIKNEAVEAVADDAVSILGFNADAFRLMEELIADPNMEARAEFQMIAANFSGLADTMRKRNAYESVKFEKLRDMVNTLANGTVSKQPDYLPTENVPLYIASRNMGLRICRDGNRLVTGSAIAPELHHDFDNVLRFMFSSYGEYILPVLKAVTPELRAELSTVLMGQLEDITTDTDVVSAIEAATVEGEVS